MGNRYTEKSNKEEQAPNQEDLLLEIMKQEFPDDPVFESGELLQSKSQQRAFNQKKADPIDASLKNRIKRNESGILNVTAEFVHEMKDGTTMKGLVHDGDAVPGTEKQIPVYAKYNIKKSFPTIDEDELDEIIDEEWEYFEDALDEPVEEIIEKGESGIFIANRPFALRDIHDLYIQEGPELIMQIDEDDLEDITDIFCIFFTDDGIAYPIPNYKTLEVMLVEKGLQYTSVKAANQDQFDQFDLIMDGDGDPDISPINEFRTRIGKGIVRDRSLEWSTSIRFRSGYEVKMPFKRDPADYLKPVALRGNNESETATGPRIDLYQQEDLEDLYFDMAFMGQTTREKLRDLFEGKLIILDWTDPDAYRSSDVGRDTDVGYDDAVLGLRMMINGHWKQVRSPFVMRLYAEMNSKLFTDDKGRMALTDYNETQGRYGTRGYINLLVKSGAVTVINDVKRTDIISDDGKSDPIWSLFSHIVEADGDEQFADKEAAAAAGIRPDGRRGLDKLEYIEYLDNYTNGGKPFIVPELAPYEPAGSVAYYDQDQYRSLIAEAVVQGQIDSIKDDILEVFPGVAATVQETRALYNTLPTNYNEYVTNMLGANSPMYKVMRSDKPWKFVKKRRKKLKRKDTRHNIFKLYSRNRRLRWDLSESEENRIVSNGGKHWMKTVARDKFHQMIVQLSGMTHGFMWAVHPLAGQGSLSAFGVSSVVNRLMGRVAHGRTDKLPPWKFMDDDWYLNACISAQWIGPVKEMYERGSEIDLRWQEITDYLNYAEGIVEDFDDLFTNARNVEDFQNLLNSLDDIDAAINDPEVLALIGRASQIRLDVDNYLKTALLNQYKAIEYMRMKVWADLGRRNRFGIIYPNSVQQIFNKYVYGQKLNFNRYIPRL